MQLRDHPHMCYRGQHAWPPIWVRNVGGRKCHGKYVAVPRGEVGVLLETRYDPERRGRVFLLMEHQGAQYTGVLLFDDLLFCDRVASRLSHYLGMSIEEIGSTDMP
jgi:hypothetical protein